MSILEAHKVVLVTGCSQGGIGAALCEEFAERGYHVYASARRLESLEGFKHTEIRKLELDVTNDEACTHAIQRVVDAEGRIDVIVSNAGRLCIGPIGEISIKNAQDTFDTNVFGTIRLVQAALPHMAKRHTGLVITIGSIAAELTMPWNGIYAASKAALHSVAEILSMECKPFGVQTMNVITGSVKSNISNNHAPIFSMPENSMYKAYTERILQRLHLSQGPYSMPTENYARQVVDLAERPIVPVHARLGARIWAMTFLTWLPRWLMLSIVWRLTGRLRPST